jgi:peptidoglycan/xylan/chitin deacetylase (PgdA/CDA1 family)
VLTLALNEFPVSNSFVVLTFHALDELGSAISFSPHLFKQGMAELYERGYKTLSISDAVECLRRDTPFPERSFALTFDDGYQSVYREAFPILQRYNFLATVFLTVGENGKPADTDRLPSMCERSMLNWREIKEMHRSGIIFGGHTLTHPDLTLLPDQQIEAEVMGGKIAIEDALGTAVDTFAYPFGRYNERCRELVSRHFLCACSDRLGLFRTGSDLYAMERVDAYYLRTERLFRTMLTSVFPWYVRARNVPRRIRRAAHSLYPHRNNASSKKSIE